VLKVDDSVTQSDKTKDVELKEVVANSSQSSNQIGITAGVKVVEVDAATSKKVCDVCDEKVAVAYCPLCNQACCDGCLQFNHRTKAKQVHAETFVMLNDDEDTGEQPNSMTGNAAKKMCDVCDEKVALVYCPLCNQSCCNDCLQFNHRTEAKKGHATSFAMLESNLI